MTASHNCAHTDRHRQTSKRERERERERARVHHPVLGDDCTEKEREREREREEIDKRKQ